MEADIISKNGYNTKSQLNRGYFIRFVVALFAMGIVFAACDDKEQEQNDVDTGEKENLPPSNFETYIDNISYNSVTIRWDEAIDPEGGTVVYTIHLDGSVIAENISQLNYTFTGLNELTNYSGRIIAMDYQRNETFNIFSFTTEKFYLKYLKKFDYGKGDVWPYSHGSPYSMIKTKDLNYLIAGKSSRPDGNGYQFFVLKIDYDGNEIWKKFYDYQIGDSWKFKITESSTGFLLVGHHHILNIDDNGSLIWYKKIDSYDIADASAEIRSIKQDSHGNIFFVGGRGSEKLGVAQEGVVTKLDGLGNTLWEKTFISEEHNFFYDLLITPSEELVVLGHAPFRDEYHIERSDFWVYKLSNEGVEIWCNKYGDDRFDFPSQIILKSNGNYVFAGHSLDNRSGYYTNAGRIFEIDKDGNEIMNISTSLSCIYSIAETTDNGFITTGSMEYGGYIYYDLGIFKFDVHGNEEWHQIHSETFTDLVGWSVLTEDDGGYRIAGNQSKIWYYDDEKPELLVYKTDHLGNHK